MEGWDCECREVWPSPEIAFVSPFQGAAVRSPSGSPRSCRSQIFVADTDASTTAAMRADGGHGHHHQGVPPQAASRVRLEIFTTPIDRLLCTSYGPARPRLPTHPNQPRPRAVGMRAFTQRPDGRSRRRGGPRGRESVRVGAAHAVTLVGVHHAAGCRQRAARARAGACASI